MNIWPEAKVWHPAPRDPCGNDTCGVWGRSRAGQTHHFSVERQ